MAFETHRNWKPRDFGRYADGTKIEDAALKYEDFTPVEDVQNQLNILDACGIDYFIQVTTSHIDEHDETLNVRTDIIFIEIPASTDTGRCPYPVYLSYSPPWMFGPYRWVLYSEAGIYFKELLKFIQKFPGFIDALAAEESDEVSQ